MRTTPSLFSFRFLSITLPSLVVCSHQSAAAPVNAVATGSWTAGTTWSDASPAAAGNDYTIDGFTVTSPTDTNTLTFPGDAITVAKTGSVAGILDLARLHANTEQIVATSLPPVTLSGGSTLQFRASTGSNRWNLGVSPIAVSGTVLFNSTGGAFAQNINLSGPVTGSGVIEYKTANSGSSTTERTLTLNSANSAYTGSWLVQHVNSGDDFGTLAAGAANALGSGTVTLDTRARLRNNANQGFDSLTGITLNQSTSTVFFNGRDWTNPAAVFTMTQGVANIGTAHLSIASASQANGTINLTMGSTKNGRIITSGNANFPGGTFLLAYGVNPEGKTFDIVTYGGNLVTPPLVDAGDTGRLTATVNNGSGTNDKVSVSMTGSVASLVWAGNDVGFENDWDNNIALNFDNGGTSDRFRQFDHVTFGNTTGSVTPNLFGTLSPASVTFNHSTNDYTLGGAGSLTGPTSITKQGSGNLTIANTTANTFTGGINISGGNVAINSAQNYTGNITITGGKLTMGNASALGATGSRTVSVTGGGQLDYNGFSPGTGHTHTFRISGDGGGTGVLTNSSATSVGANAGILNLELLGNATVGGTGRFDIGRVGTTSGTITGNGHTLTKAGANQIMLRGAATGLTTVINAGILGVEDSDLAFGGATGSITVNDTAVVGTFGARTIATPLTLNAGSTLRNLGGAASTWSGSITLGGNAIIEGAGANTTSLSGSIAESGGAHTLTIRNTTTTAGNYTFNLSNTSTRTGPTILRGSAFRVSQGSALGSGPITIESNGTVGVQTRLELSGVTLANDINLSSTAQTGFFGPVTAVNGSTSTASGILTVTANVGNGGHFASSGAGSVLRLTGTINSTGPVPNIRQGVVEMGTTGGNLTALAQGEGTIRLVANNGIQPSVDLRMAVSAAGILDLNGFNQTLAQIKRNVPDQSATGTSHAATVTNTATTPSVLTLEGSTNHQFSGVINNGTGGISLVKKGGSTVTILGAQSYAGDTTVDAGTLSLNAAYLADASAVRIATGATLNLTHTATDTVDRLFVDGVQQAAGTYNSGNTTYITGTGSLNVTSGPVTDPFATWATTNGLDGSPGKEAGFENDPDGDGIENGLEWILGGLPLDGQGGTLVSATRNGSGDLVLTFDREEDAIGETSLTVEYNGTLASPWNSVTIGATSAAPDANGVEVSIDTLPSPDVVTVTIPASQATGGKLFARIKATQP
ncbi:MAG: autotransporter-associated beta strand repeat-containing protein [Akkermansiaceae bacterium]|jgi:autotransporter-associated beta strand protein|nr:autotransporter-associated beta strand repeat-containing protein [Akkermansiaceae bacterium]